MSAEAAHHHESPSEAVTAKSNSWLDAAIVGTLATVGSVYLLNLSTRYLPVGIATGEPISLGIGVGSALLGTALGYVGAGRGGPGERAVNVGSAVMSVIAPIFAPALANISKTAHTISSAFGMRHLFAR